MKPTLQSYKINEHVVFGRTFFTPPRKISDSLINEARIVHVIKGESRLYCANKLVHVKSGDTFIMKSDNFVNNWLENNDKSENEIVVFQITSALLKLIYQDHSPKWMASSQSKNLNVGLEKLPNHLMMNQFFDGLKNYIENDEYLTEELIALKIKELISLCLQLDQQGEVKQIFSQLFHAGEYKLQEVIQKNLFEDLSVEDLAFLSGLSLSSFKRKFTALYGTSPNKYIISKRLEKAQDLLKNSEQRVADIAYECGFSDVAYFSKSFKSYYQYSPSELRKG